MHTTPPSPSHPLRALAVATAVAVLTLLVLDLVWLGVVAREFYDTQLGPLKRPDVYWPAAAAFYAMYIGAVLVHAVLGSAGPVSAFGRGAGLGLVAYATYDLTNWAVLQGWPALLAPVDIAWGVVLTGVVALASKVAHSRVAGTALPDATK